MSRRPRRSAGGWRLVLLAAVAVAAVAVTGCRAPEGARHVTVTLVNLEDGRMRLDLEPATLPAGPVTFDIVNAGWMVHEVEVLAGVEDGTALPLLAGVADTSGLTLVDEVEDVLPGAQTTLTTNLAPGPHLVICNLPGHYAAGMVASLTVTAAG